MPSFNFRKAQFLISCPTLKECPAETGGEVAFAGRSNAGKSSAINKLTGNKKLARTSKTPGRTQLINFFTLGDDDYRLVDLPGYGFAKVPLSVKNEWQAHLSEYLQARMSLRGLVLLMDIRHPLQEFDLFMLDWCSRVGMPVHILLTKCDKLSRGAAKSTLLKVQQQIRTEGLAERFSLQVFSAQNGEGLETLEKVLHEWLSTDPHAGAPQGEISAE